jgi:phosphopantothenoylcysteine decarboxylase/phosphopantothenate--cysteine ligase
VEVPQAFDPLDGQPDFEEAPEHRPLYGKHVLVTAGPTYEPIDPVRYIANRSSGKQGFAIAAAAAAAGARVTLVSGPVTLATPPGVDRIDVETAEEMAKAVKKALPADAAVMVAAVADWRTKDFAQEKIKKRGSAPPALLLAENPDILASVSAGKQRPRLLIGFAAETEDVVPNAQRKRKAKGVDWIVANDVTPGPQGEGAMGGDENTVHLVREGKTENWEPMSKQAVARKLVERMAEALADACRGRGAHQAPAAWGRTGAARLCDAGRRRDGRRLGGGHDARARRAPRRRYRLFRGDPARLRDSGASALRPGAQAWDHGAEHTGHD